MAKRHAWVWVKDRTVKSSTMGGMVRIARKGIYRCACGETKYGDAKSGL